MRKADDTPNRVLLPPPPASNAASAPAHEARPQSAAPEPSLESADAPAACSDTGTPWVERLRARGVIVLGAVVPDLVATVTTFASVWLLDTDTYLRLPKNENPDDARSHESAWGRLDDGRRMPYRQAVWTVEPDGAIHVRIHPTAGPEAGYGISTGPVTAAIGLAATDPIHQGNPDGGTPPDPETLT